MLLLELRAESLPEFVVVQLVAVLRQVVQLQGGMLLSLLPLLELLRDLLFRLLVH